MAQEKLVVILIGPPGAGKGTQLELLQNKLGLEVIGSGELLRERKKRRDFTGRKIGQCIDVGNRVPTPVIFKLWVDRMEKLKKLGNLKGFIIDGSPRTIFEAEMIDLSLGWYEWSDNTKVVYIKISKEESISRLTNRRICKNCGHNIPYIGNYKKLTQCDKCGGELYKRPDDTKKGIRVRWKWFRTDVMPALNYYRRANKLLEVNGEQSIENVSKDIFKVIKQK